MYRIIGKEKEKFLLVGLITDNSRKKEKIDSLDELASLVETAGGEVVERIIQKRDDPDPAYFIGKGKAQEISSLEGFGTILFDDALTPGQISNLSKLTERKILDRRDIILDIFAQHARTRAAKIEVELAQLKFTLPRLKGRGIELSRLGGGIGTRGPGEKKLEIDRRRIFHRIRYLEKELVKISRSREVQRKKRSKIFKVALLGYTNVGKSTLLNVLTHSSTYVDNKLFATLDPLTRICRLSSEKYFVVTDTIGFIRNIPPQLIASFHSTLEEAIIADLRLVVIDISSGNFEFQMSEAKKLMETLGMLESNHIFVFNKIDLFYDQILLESIKERYPDDLFISAKKGIGIDKLKERIGGLMEKREITV